MGIFALSAGIDSAALRKLLTRRHIEKLTTIVRLGLILLMLLVLAYTFAQAIEGIFGSRSLILDLEKGTEVEIAKLEQSFSSKGRKRDISKVKESSVFGSLQTAKNNKPTKEAPKPKSDVPLNLIGTFVSDDSSSFAIIEDKKKRLQEVFNIGDMIFEEAELVKIHPDHVEIKRNSKIEILPLDDSAISGKSSSTASSGSETEFDVEEAELNAALDDLPLLLTQARAVPYFRDGRAIGLRMFAIKNGSLYQKIGLKNGDILKSVNGSSLANIQEAMKLFERLKEERSIAVELERNKQDLQFRYTIK